MRSLRWVGLAGAFGCADDIIDDDIINDGIVDYNLIYLLKDQWSGMTTITSLNSSSSGTQVRIVIAIDVGKSCVLMRLLENRFRSQH